MAEKRTFLFGVDNSNMRRCQFIKLEELRELPTIGAMPVGYLAEVLAPLGVAPYAGCIYYCFDWILFDAEAIA